jgi:hypothetical protein
MRIMHPAIIAPGWPAKEKSLKGAVARGISFRMPGYFPIALIGGV